MLIEVCLHVGRSATLKLEWKKATHELSMQEPVQGYLGPYPCVEGEGKEFVQRWVCTCGSEIQV